MKKIYEMYDDRIILLDADVIIHFIRGWQLDVLPEIYNSEYWIIDKVFDELYGLGVSGKVLAFIREHDNVLKKDLPMEMEIIQYYAYLELRFGRGESAVMAMARAKNEVVASSNIKDVEKYCTDNDIDWITTMDILADAYSKGIYTAKNCDDFIRRVRKTNSKLPNTSIQQYIKQH